MPAGNGWSIGSSTLSSQSMVSKTIACVIQSALHKPREDLKINLAIFIK